MLACFELLNGNASIVDTAVGNTPSNRWKRLGFVYGKVLRSKMQFYLITIDVRIPCIARFIAVKRLV